MLSIGDTVFIEEMIDDQIIYYKSKLVDQLDQTIHLDIPINENTGRNAIFLKNTTYKVLFLTKKSVLYSCRLTYIHSIHEPIPVLVFTKPNQTELELEQRRQFFRIASTTEITVFPMEKEFDPFDTLTQDISAGGVAIHVPKSIHFQMNQRISLKMKLMYENSITEEVTVESEIVRIRESETNSNKQLISLKYSNLSNQSQQKIVKYTIEQQRRHIQSLKLER